MGRSRHRVVYFVLLPAIISAAGILGYYSWITASQYALLGEQTIGESTLLLVREKVDVIERFVIAQDNDVFSGIDVRDPAADLAAWRASAEERTPSVRAVLVLDDSGNVSGYSIRGNERDEREFLKVFEERILPDLELEQQRVGRLKHLHRSYANASYLISYRCARVRGRRYYLIAHHDTGFIVRNQLASLFATEEGKRLYNVVDQNNVRVHGPSLAQAGDYLVGHRFPTTLYEWRLQVAPKQAPRLEAQARSRRLNEVGLIGTALLVILLGVGFLLYAADKERRLNALKSEFIANVSHELKTPLSVVRMFSEMLLTRRVASQEKRQRYLELILHESERLSALIDNVLDFAALERGKRRYDLRRGDVADVVSSALETFRYRVEREGTEISLTMEPGLPAVEMDEQALVLAVVNLLDNAVKYGGGSPVDVEVARAGDRVVVRVRDRGPGIPVDDLRRIFDRFYRSRRDGQTRGSGIGLSLVKHIAEAHRGRAWAENAPDGGAIVGVSLPVARAASQPPPASKPSSDEDAIAAEA